MFMRAIAIMPPGMFLSQPPITNTPSRHLALHTVSIESAITSRDTSEYFMPSVPIEMPSETVIVPNVCGITPDFRSAAPARLGLAPRRFGALRQMVEPEVARRDRAVTVGDADDRLGEIGVGEPGGAQHR